MPGSSRFPISMYFHRIITWSREIVTHKHFSEKIQRWMAGDWWRLNQIFTKELKLVSRCVFSSDSHLYNAGIMIALGVVFSKKIKQFIWEYLDLAEPSYTKDRASENRFVFLDDKPCKRGRYTCCIFHSFSVRRFDVDMDMKGAAWINF